jgi:hypothetical protein
MIRHDPNRKHIDTFKGPYPLTKVNDNAGRYLGRYLTVVQEHLPGI